MFILSIFLILLSNSVLEYAYYGFEVSSAIQLNNLFNAFSQFMVLTLAPIIGGIISSDLTNNSIKFYNNNSISTIRYFYTRILIFSLMGTLILCVFFIFHGFYIRVYNKTDIFVYFLILLNFYIVVSIGGLFSLIYKKRGKVTVAMVFYWFIMCLINIIPIPYLKGKLFTLDSNSFISHVISNMLGLKITNINFNSALNINNKLLANVILICLFWLVFYNTLTFILLRRKEYFQKK